MELHRELSYGRPNGSPRRAILVLSFFSVHPLFGVSIACIKCHVLVCPGCNPRGGGLLKMWSSMLEQNLVWNGGSKIEKWCGIVWTQIGGKIVSQSVIWGSKSEMTQNVCGMAGFPAQRACVLL